MALQQPPYDDLMLSLHGTSIWRDGRLLPQLGSLGLVTVVGAASEKIFGSLLKGVEDLLRQYKPKIFLEVGVFRGATSTRVANFFKNERGLKAVMS